MFAESGDRFNFFLPPYVVFGRGTRSNIPDYTKRLGMAKVLLVVDPFFVETDYFTEIEQGLRETVAQVSVWSGVVPDPTDMSVDDAVKAYKDAGCDGVVCIGGGSGMDTGKSVAIVIASGAKSIREHTPPTNRSVSGMAPVICVPTTAGTGAEVNPYAIVSNTETGKKGLAYPGWELLSAQKLAIVDPDLTASMSSKLTAVTGVDALCQAVECYITKTPNPISDALALRAIDLIARNLRRAVYDGQDMKARTAMSLAATLGTMAFPNAGLTHAHALNEVLIERYHMSHGEAVGAVLVGTLESLLPFRVARLAELAEILGVPSQGRGQRAMAEAAIREIQQLLEDIGFPTLSQAAGGVEVNVEAVLADFLDRYPNFKPPVERERVSYTLKRSLEF